MKALEKDGSECRSLHYSVGVACNQICLSCHNGSGWPLCVFVFCFFWGPFVLYSSLLLLFPPLLWCHQMIRAYARITLAPILRYSPTLLLTHQFPLTAPQNTKNNNANNNKRKDILLSEMYFSCVNVDDSPVQWRITNNHWLLKKWTCQNSLWTRMMWNDRAQSFEHCEEENKL